MGLRSSGQIYHSEKVVSIPIGVLRIKTQKYINAFAKALKENKMQQIIYVPTEANIPILEAGKRP